MGPGLWLSCALNPGVSNKVHSILCWGDGAANYTSKLIRWSENRFLEMSWQGWVPSLDIFNFLDRWTEEGFQLLGGEVGGQGCENYVSLIQFCG